MMVRRYFKISKIQANFSRQFYSRQFSVGSRHLAVGREENETGGFKNSTPSVEKLFFIFFSIK
jgi:hypothetical protein